MRSAALAGAAPLCTADVELSEPIEALTARASAEGTAYDAAVLLVRLHGAPVGEITVDLPVSASALRQAVQDQLGAQVAFHLGGDEVDPAGVDEVDQVGGDGIDAATTIRRRSVASRGGEAGEQGGAAGTAPSVSVVVATCGRPAQAQRCLAALLASDYPDFEVVVVDNDPGKVDNDRGKGAAATVVGPHLAGDARLRYLVEPRRGASRARNAGIDVARGDIVAFTDDDVVVDPGWLAALGRTFASHPEVACVTGLTLPYRLDTAAQRDFERIAGFGGGYRHLRFHRDMDPPPTRLFPFTSGIAGSSNNLAVRADILRRIGRFDLRLGPGTSIGGAEDLDLLTRILLDGGEVRYEPRVLVRHDHRVAEGAVRQQIFSYGTGATAVLTKWLLVSPALRRLLAANAWSIAREITRAEVTRDPSVARVTGPPHAKLQRSRILGYLCGPVLWILALGRSAWRP